MREAAETLGGRVIRLILESSTCPVDLPGATAGMGRQDKLVCALARRAPWLLRVFLAKLARHLKRGDLDAVLSGLQLGKADADIVQQEDVRQRSCSSSPKHSGGDPRGLRTIKSPKQDRGIPLGEVRVPAEIWHGDDGIVPPARGVSLAKALPRAATHFVPGEGHFSLAMHHAHDILRSALGDPRVGTGI